MLTCEGFLGVIPQGVEVAILLARADYETRYPGEYAAINWDILTDSDDSHWFVLFAQPIPRDGGPRDVARFGRMYKLTKADYRIVETSIM